MENMLKKIIEADNKAKTMEEDILLQKENLSKEINAEADKIYASYIEKAEETVARNNLAEEKIANQKWAEISNKHKSIEIMLEADYNRNAEKWADMIVKRTIS